MKEQLADSFILTIDRGNTRIKVSLCDGFHRVDGIFLSDFRLGEVIDFCKGHTLQGAVCCSVGRVFDSAIVADLRSALGVDVLNIDHSTPLPIEVEYASPASLGLDRVAAAAGAAALFPGCAVLVADAGTALTLDLVDANAVFRGGNISPGLGMRLRAMHEFTVSLPQVAVDGDVPLFGYDTSTAMRAGAIRGMASEISGAFAAGRCLGVSDLLLCGGDADTIFPFLDIPDSSPHIVAHLLEAGLVSIFKHNLSL